MTTAPDYAGLRQYARSRSTGTHVGLYNNAEAGFDDDDGTNPWSTVCEEHGGIVSHPTWKVARWHAPNPENWCPTCQRIARGLCPCTYPEAGPDADTCTCTCGHSVDLDHEAGQCTVRTAETAGV